MHRSRGDRVACVSYGGLRFMRLPRSGSASCIPLVCVAVDVARESSPLRAPAHLQMKVQEGRHVCVHAIMCHTQAHVCKGLAV